LSIKMLRTWRKKEAEVKKEKSKSKKK